LKKLASQHEASDGEPEPPLGGEGLVDQGPKMNHGVAGTRDEEQQDGIWPRNKTLSSKKDNL
jgi:hypothetical protein